MPHSSERPGRRKKNSSAGRPARRPKGQAQSSHPWWEDWRWLGALAAIILTSGAVLLLSRGRPESVSDRPPASVARVEAEPESSPPTGPQLPPLNNDTTEREIAEWILETGGAVSVVDATDAVFYATQKSQLPDAPQRVLAAYLSDLTELQDDDLDRLSGCLAIQELQLDRTKIADSGLRQLESLVTLQRLSLDETNITEAGLASIGKLARLRMLSLSIPLSDAGLSELQRLKELRGFRFSGSAATDSGLKLVCEAFPQLTHLATDEMALTDSGVEPLRQLSKLRLLGLTRAPVSDDCVDRLGRLSTLTHLLIPGTQITRGGADRLRRQLPDCQVLGGQFDPARFLAAQILLEGGRVTVSTGEAEPRQVSTLSGLPEGGLRYHAIDLRGVQSLKRGSLVRLLRWKEESVLRKVHTLSLARSSVDPADLNRLPELLDGLQSLDISHTAADDGNYDQLMRLFWLSDTLNVEGTHFSTEMQAKIRSCARGGCRVLDGTPVDETVDRRVAEWVLSVGGTLVVGQHGPAGEKPRPEEELATKVNRIEQLPDAPFIIRHVDVSDCESVRDDDFARFISLRRLYRVRLGNCRVSDVCLQHLAQIPTLRELTMFGCKPGFTDEGMKSLAVLPHVTHMHLMFADISAAGLRNLGYRPRVDSILLSGDGIDDDAIEQLVKNLPNLAQLRLTRAMCSDVGLDRLKKLGRLTKLTIHSPRITNAGVTAICSLPRLTELEVSGQQITDEAFEPLIHSDTIRHVNLSGTSATRELATRLRRKHPQLTFGLSGRDSTLLGLLNWGAKIHGQSPTRSLTQLTDESDFPARDFVVHRIDFEGATMPERYSLAPFSWHLPEIHEISLKDTGTQVVGFEYLAACRHLTSLNLEGTHVEDVHLKQCRPLPSLKLINLKGTGVSAGYIRTLKQRSRGCRILSD